MSTLTLVIFAAVLCPGITGPQRGTPVPQGVRQADKLPNPADVPPQLRPLAPRVDAAKLKSEADELARLAQSVRSGIEQIAGGQLPKHLDGQLKQIGRLSKRKRRR